MPELPEVELVARALRKHCAGRVVAAARMLRPQLLREASPQQFARRLRHRTLADVSRRGKHLLLRFDEDAILIVHLRMTGRFLLLPEKAPLPTHTHALWRFADGDQLAFNDQRHFGMMKLVSAANLHETKELRSLAPEPFSTDFTENYLRRVLAGSRRALKETLLDQTRVTGLGNIYAAEALFHAKINPHTKSSQLSRTRVNRLRTAILTVLAESIAHGSTLNVDPRDIENSYYGGGYYGRWAVYDRAGEPCLVCRSPIRRTVQAGRSTYYCPKCQKQ
ncbi:MAG TPA: bifunctional DNA-formamidopyrimidine glycosylase/DNA-(apurinic or apyrimidinic site) lyase [Pyrinomonadaceae bacterium]|jgi:formamidopyrimidine-DNA glycosylase|nr:bifunctional DNA-formamidopyrimidine glycosylase/DNA-(apurinic or apyrimidinic site) lyase [Pyrinomonadaceae bacterium]